jgi:hypothetical protein
MSASGARLGALTKELYVQWQHTKDSWHDDKAREFERQFLQELFTSVDKTVTVIEQIDKLIAKIKKDCE